MLAVAQAEPLEVLEIKNVLKAVKVVCADQHILALDDRGKVLFVWKLCVLVPLWVG